MTTVDELLVRAPAQTCFRVAADVERWPEILPHYRWVRFREKRGFGRGLVEMAAWRPFGGPLRYPTWWVSEMLARPEEPLITYAHVQGITRGMDVRWEFEERSPDRTLVRIVHEWSGPAWPLIGRFAADRVIGPKFVSAIAQRTLRGVGAASERLAKLEAAPADRTRSRRWQPIPPPSRSRRDSARSRSRPDRP